MEESNNQDHLAKAMEELQKAIFAAYRKAYRIKKFNLKINKCWNQYLQIKGKRIELQALKRRNNKSQGDNKRKYQLLLSKSTSRAKQGGDEGKEEFFLVHL
ncbi:hypothetical protein AVEN_113723-1 [Araneus ventricosus]|uniref:Uncharacterized protein n=1 Tax=Araneus ventricosus TaxID=182803 RepID=A0A4Y2HX31_ARAVE|nr:hypothetical protein AVEN_113723-1 [Araneus ventricosus]